MRNQWTRPEPMPTMEVQDTQSALHRKRLRSWLLLGAGAVGAAGAVAKWAFRARQKASQDTVSGSLAPSSVPTSASYRNATTKPETFPEMPPSAAPTNDARTVFVEPAPAPREAESPSEEASPLNVSVAPKAKTGSRKRSKMSEEYDQALQANIIPTDGREGERENQSLLVSEEDKLAIGEELRGREFPVPAQQNNISSQRLVVNQETMRDDEFREGGAIGTLAGDRQNKGEVGDIMDQDAETPDFAQQR